MKRKLLTALASIVLSSTVAGAAFACTPAHEFQTVKQGVLTVAAVTYRPYAIVEPDGSLSGVDGEVLKEIAKRECLRIEAVAVDGAAALNYVQTGRADVTIGSWYRTKSRAEVLNMSDPLYLVQMAILSEDGTAKLADLEGKTVGTVQGNLWVPDLKKIYGPNLKIYPSLPLVLQDLVGGRLDAVVETSGIAIAKVALDSGQINGFRASVASPDKRVSASILPGQAAFPLNKDNDDILKAFNENIAALHANGYIRRALVSFGLDESAADVGPARWGD